MLTGVEMPSKHPALTSVLTGVEMPTNLPASTSILFVGPFFNRLNEFWLNGFWLNGSWLNGFWPAPETAPSLKILGNR